MYTILLWSKTARRAIAKAELDPYRQAELAKYTTPQARDVVNAAFDRGELVVEHNIHPLVLLKLRRKMLG